MRPPTLALAVVAGSALALPLSAAGEGALRVTSAAFSNGGAIPAEYSCDGRGASPPLHWTGAPPDTKSFAIVVDDPDAPHGPFVHWVAFDLPASTTDLSTGASAHGTKWKPVCPPKGGGVHHYHFKLLALRDPPGLALDQPGEDDLMKAVRGHVLATGELVGTFERK
jgi:phosphatidylethanolamine-binding protein (PEBP) family uncharacterized protein